MNLDVVSLIIGIAGGGIIFWIISSQLNKNSDSERQTQLALESEKLRAVNVVSGERKIGAIGVGYQGASPLMASLLTLTPISLTSIILSPLALRQISHLYGKRTWKGNPVCISQK